MLTKKSGQDDGDDEDGNVDVYDDDGDADDNDDDVMIGWPYRSFCICEEIFGCNFFCDIFFG